MSGETPQESTTERSNYEDESSDTSKEQSECTTTKIGQIKTVTEKITHSTVTITTTKTPGRTETKTESKVTETITITEEGGQTPEMTNTTNEEERTELSDLDVKEEESRRSTATNSAIKGKELEEEFKKKVDRLKLKCEVSYQTPIHFKLGVTEKTCIPDVVFRNEKKAAIVDLKNYDKTSKLSKRDVDKLARDMKVVKQEYKCTEVWGYIYIKGGYVSITEDEHASEEGIIIVREAEKTVEKLVHHIDKKLST